ncbi:serine/threonine-protein kinase NIM1-like [Hypanus sabinus]|uniref:serine/threonine-protein kinase NIM1-like n=1 Tax=Hypanus sabinus TaxID=79690 RepID=UPI0028C472AA|nr:serine/threonine-protein kinase NIM1-like [Hypanus sabinus]
MMAVALSIHSEGLHKYSSPIQGIKRQIQRKMDKDELSKRENTVFTPLEKVIYDMRNNEKVKNELILGKRVGFYQLRGQIGIGNFSKVKLGIHCLTKERVAIKIMDKKHITHKRQDLFINEVLCMEQLHHPNIIRLYEVLETQTRLYLVLEYAEGGDLFTKICTQGRLSEHESKFIFIQIVSAVKHMHENNVVHRDLKAENVFYSATNHMKVGDFGFSILRPVNEPLNMCCGSPPYAAPELFREKGYFGIHVDIWALGILLYFMVTATLPFRADTVKKLKKCILLGSYAVPPYVSDPCKKLIHGILQPIPTNRYTIANILDSQWLREMQVPEPYQPFHLSPDHLAGHLPLSEEEKEVKKTLSDLGITEEHIYNNLDLESHNPISGTYRIILHRTQKRYNPGGCAMISNFSSANRPNQRKCRNFRARVKNSKMCLLL